MLGRLVAESIERQGYAHPWGDLLDELRRFDLLIVNLEVALTGNRQPEPKVFNFRAAPDCIECLVKAGVDVCVLANNHIRDFGLAGMQETIAVLERAGIAHAGAGGNLAGAMAPATRAVAGIRINVISATDNEPGWAATPRHPGVFALDWDDPAAVLAAVGDSAQAADVTILSLHWGPNMRERPTNQFIEFAHRAIDAGARVIHGHSAHVFQGVEFYRNGIILYDCGDFVDDYMVDVQLRNDRALLFELSLAADRSMTLRALPAQIEAMQVKHADAVARRWIAMRLARLCKPFGATVRDDGLWLTLYGSV